MPKEGKFWFDHDYGARNDDKILELRAEFGAEGYGVFWMIIETMADSETASINYSRIGGLSHGYGVAKAKLSEIIDFCVTIGLLINENGNIISQRVVNHKEHRKSYSINGRKGAEKRWPEKEKNIAEPLPSHSHPIATPMAKNSRGEEIREDKKDNTVLEPMSEKEFREFSQKMKDDQLFLQPLFSSGLKPEFLDKWIIRFHVHIVGEEKINKNYHEYRKHFKNWLNKQEYSQPPPILTALEKIKAGPSYIKSEKETDFDKYRKNGI